MRDPAGVPENLRPAILAFRDRLATVIDALFEIAMLCDHADSLETLARSKLPSGNIGVGDSLRPLDASQAWLDAAYRAALSRFADEFNATLQDGSLDEEPIDLDRILQMVGVRWQIPGSGFDDAFCSDHEMEGQRQQLRDAGQRPPREIASDRASFDLERQLRQQHDGMMQILARISNDHGPALLALINRYKSMVQNFQRLSKT